MMHKPPITAKWFSMVVADDLLAGWCQGIYNPAVPWGTVSAVNIKGAQV